MSTKMFFTIFFTVFVAELGDKTQLTTLLFATDKKISPWGIFAASAAALVTTSALGVVAGTALSQAINEKYLRLASGIAFLAIGLWTVAKTWW